MPEPLKPLEEHPDEAKEVIEELPEHVQIIETPTDKGPNKRTIIKKQVIKKKKGKKEEVTEIITKQVDDKKPETIVTVSEVESQVEEHVEPLKPLQKKPEKAKQKKTSMQHDTAEITDLLVEFKEKTEKPISTKPEDQQITEVMVEEGKPKKKTIKRRITKSKKIEPTQIIETITLLDEDTATPLDEVHTKFTYLTNILTIIIYFIKYYINEKHTFYSFT